MVDGHDYILSIGMTAILAWADGEDLYIAADSLAWDEKGNHYPYEYKIARVNRYAAVGFTGEFCYGWQFFGNLFGVSDRFRAEDEEWLHIVRAIEKQGIIREDLDLGEICKFISGFCGEVLTKTEEARKKGRSFAEFKGGIVLATAFDGEHNLFGWKDDTEWVLERIALENPVVASPGSHEALKAVRKLLRRENLPPERKATRSLKKIATFSHLVNENGTLRRASRGFELEVLYDEPAH